jgi:hypothetical protein
MNKSLDEYIKLLVNIIKTFDELVINNITNINDEFWKIKWYDAWLKDIVDKTINLITQSKIKLNDIIIDLQKWFFYKSANNYFNEIINDKNLSNYLYYIKQLKNHFMHCEILLSRNNTNIFTDTNINDIKWDLLNSLNALSEIPDILHYIKKEHLLYDDKDKYYLKEIKTNHEWIYFNTDNWEVFKDWVLLWDITIWTLEFNFFKYLYDNKWVYKNHEDIFAYLKWWTKNRIKSSYLSDIKSRIENKEIRNLIKSPKMHYIIP